MDHRKYIIPNLDELEVNGMFTFMGSNVLNKIVRIDDEQVTYVTNPILPKGQMKKSVSSVELSLGKDDLDIIDHWTGPIGILTFDTLEEYRKTYDDDYKTCLRSEFIIVMGYVVGDQKWEGVTIPPDSLSKIMFLTSVEQYISAFPGYPEHGQEMFDYMSKWNQIPIS